MAKTWLTFTDDDYNRFYKKWKYTAEVDSVEYADNNNIKRYLPKRAAWEKDPNYKLRINAADPNMDFALLMGKTIGMALTTEDDDTREFSSGDTEGLGSINDPESPIGRLWHNADGEGTSYPVLWRKYARDQLVYQWMYILVDGLSEEEIYDDEGNVIASKITDARVKLISPDQVLAKDASGGAPSWMKVRHTASSGARWDEEEEMVDYYTVYHLEGWERYRMGEKGVAIMEDEGEYEFYTDRTKEQRRLPIFLVKLPFKTYIAHYLARKSISIFNQESQRDSFIANADIHFVDEGNPVEFEARKDDILAGETHHNVAKGTKAYYISPPSAPAELATAVIDKKRKSLWESAYQQYGDAAKESTATEIKQEARSGIEAFLRQLVTTWDEAENQTVFLLEQIYFPDDPSRWGAHKIERSKKFAVLDSNQFVSMMVNTVFRGDLPLTEGMVKQVTKTIWEKHLGFILPEDTEIDPAIKAYLDSKQGLSRTLNIGGDGSAGDEPVFNDL